MFMYKHMIRLARYMYPVLPQVLFCFMTFHWWLLESQLKKQNKNKKKKRQQQKKQKKKTTKDPAYKTFSAYSTIIV